MNFHFACMLCLVSHLATADPDTLKRGTSENDATIEALHSHSMALLDKCADIDAIETAYPSNADAHKSLKVMPTPVQQYLRSFACLCDLQELDKQVPHLQETLKGLEQAIDFYLDQYGREVHETALANVHFHLFGESIDFVWDGLSTEYRPDIVVYIFIGQGVRLDMVHFEDFGKKFYRDWQNIVYRGLYCIAKGNPPSP